LPTAGIHGTEHCNRARWTLLPFRSPVSGFPAPGSTLPGSPLAAARSGSSRSQRPFARLQRLRRLGASIPGSMLPACCFALRLMFPLPGPLPAPAPVPVCTRPRHLPRGTPVAASPSGVTGCFSGHRSPSGL
jgi:hypothetical protein